MYLIVKAPATWTVDTLGTNSPPAVVSYINELITDPSSHKGLTYNLVCVTHFWNNLHQ
jgi:hypothetical protein